jgi:hypothetical protein
MKSSMKFSIRLLIFILSFFTVECFIKPLFIPRKLALQKYIHKMSKHNFLDFAGSISIADKYFLIQSLINDVVLQRKELMYDYCYKTLNYTDVMHVKISDEMTNIIRDHYKTSTVIELYDIIKTNSYSKDCHVHVYTFNETISKLPLK